MHASLGSRNFPYSGQLRLLTELECPLRFQRSTFEDCARAMQAVSIERKKFSHNSPTITKRIYSLTSTSIAILWTLKFFLLFSFSGSCIYLHYIIIDCLIAWKFSNQKFSNVHRCWESPRSPRISFWCLTTKTAVFQSWVDHKTFWNLTLDKDGKTPHWQLDFVHLGRILYLGKIYGLKPERPSTK